MTYPPSSYPFTPLILGHRGARAELVENTPAALAHACQLIPAGLAGIEFDVQLSSDGQLIIFHDDSFERLTGYPDRIDQLSLNEIRRRQLPELPILALNELSSYTFSMPPNSSQSGYHHHSTPITRSMTSASLFSAMRLFSHIELEVKTHPRTHYAALIRALEHSLIHHNLASLPLVLTSFDTTLLAYLQRHRHLSQLPRGLLVENPAMIADLGNSARRLGCRQVGLHYPLLDRAVVQQCKQFDLAISAWTVNDIKTAEHLARLGVEVLITDHPTAFVRHFIK